MPTPKELADFYRTGGTIKRGDTAAGNEVGRPGLLREMNRKKLAFNKGLGTFRLTILFTDTNIETIVGARTELVKDLVVGQSYRFPVQVSDPNFTIGRKKNFPRKTGLILFAKPQPI